MPVLFSHEIMLKVLLYNSFLVSAVPRAAPDDDAAEGSTSHVNGRSRGENNASEQDPQAGKKLSGAQRKKWSKEEKKNKRGANKGRRFQKVRDEVELCWRIASGQSCEFGSEYERSPSHLLLVDTSVGF